MTIVENFSRTAETSAPLLPVLAERWSPRAFDVDAEVSEEALTAALEAARWSPSANNSQPWRFIVGRRGTDVFDTIASTLMGFNQAWAGTAAVLIVAVAEVTDPEGKARPWATYDVGQAVAHLSVQAHHDGLHAHQMGGFDATALREAFGLDERFLAVSVTALGVLGDPNTLPDALRERELAPRTRKPLDEILVANA